jgi:cytochrome bd ubiquinol oxidase subunit II
VNPSGEAIAVATILIVVIAAYALFGGADFGGGIWDLLAGSTRRGAAPRDLIDESITPVWEANHVWLVFILVLLWTAFPPAFAAIFSALFVPLSLSLLGIVLRGVGFAFRHTAERLALQQLTGALFAAASLITPFFMGTVVGAIVTGKVPVHPAGNILGAWTSPTSILTGFLFVAACAYISAAYLVVEARRRRRRDLLGYFSRRATAAGVVTGGLAGATWGELSTTSPHVFDRLTGIALPLVAVSAAAGIAVIGMLLLRWYQPVLLRATAAIAVATVVFGWGLAQYPYLLPTSLPLAAGSAPTASLVAELIVAGLAVLLVAPGFAILYYLQQRRMLSVADSDADLRLAARLQPAIPGQPAGALAPARAGKTTALVLAVVAIKAIRDAFSGSRRRLGEGESCCLSGITASRCCTLSEDLATGSAPPALSFTVTTSTVPTVTGTRSTRDGATGLTLPALRSTMAFILRRCVSSTRRTWTRSRWSARLWT